MVRSLECVGIIHRTYTTPLVVDFAGTAVTVKDENEVNNSISVPSFASHCKICVLIHLCLYLFVLRKQTGLKKMIGCRPTTDIAGSFATFVKVLMSFIILSSLLVLLTVHGQSIVIKHGLFFFLYGECCTYLFFRLQ